MRKAHGDKCVVVGQCSATATLSRFLCHVAHVCTGSWGLHVEETHTAFLMRNTGKNIPPKQTYHHTKKSYNTFCYVFSCLKWYLVWKVTDACKIFTRAKQKAQRCNDGGRVKKSWMLCSAHRDPVLKMHDTGNSWGSWSQWLLLYLISIYIYTIISGLQGTSGYKVHLPKIWLKNNPNPKIHR